MYLSKLEILGFKSFANKTNIILNDGITAIVGPNGCGKTNIVDALRWALGEQRYSTLRSDKMEDVIFNGTKNRKPIGLAEVSLTIQNNKSVLPIDYNEVTITRRVFRSGDSDYLLNRTVCRLKDIVNLFMDTGMGSNAYSVIELKMVETILSDKVEERRRLFEEAAGVTRYKTRRREALRKLMEVDADLLRVNDIVTEVEKAVQSLHRQAKKAERYNDYMEKLRTLEIDVLQRDYTSLITRLEPLENKLVGSISDRVATEAHLARHEALLHDLRTEEREIEERLNASRLTFDSLATNLNDAEQILLVSQERHRGLQQTVERLRQSRDSYELRLKEGTEKSTEYGERVQKAEDELTVLEQRAATKREAHRSIEAEVTTKKLEAQSRQSRLMQSLQELAQLKSEREKCTSRIASIDVTFQRFDSEDAEAMNALTALRSTVEEQDSDKALRAESVLAAERRFHEMEERKNALRNDMDQLQNRAFELQGRIGEKITRIDFLSGLIDRLEGYSESVQHLLRNRDWAPTQYGTIADAVNTRDDLRIAIEAAIGDAAHYILVNDVAEALSGLQNLKATRKGKATFACLSRIPTVKAIPFALAGDGVIGWAAELVTYSAQYHELFQMLLQNVLVVRDAAVAHKCVQEYPQLRCVTLEGDIFESNGMIRGGSHGTEEGGLIGKRDQIAALQREVNDLKKLLQENQDLLDDKRLDYEEIDLRKHADEIKRAQQELSTHEQQIAQLLFEVEKHERVIQKNARERAVLIAEREELLALAESLAPRIEEHSAQHAALEEEMQSEQGKLTALEQQYNASNEELNSINVELATKRGEHQNLRNEIDRILKAADDLHRAIANAEEDIERSLRDMEQLENDIQRITQQCESLQQEKEGAMHSVKNVEAELAAKRTEIERMETQLHDVRQKHSLTVTTVHEIELKVSEIRQRIEQLRQQALEDFELQLEPHHAEDDDVFDLGQAKEEIRDLRVKVKSLGLVNPLAFEEWKKEKERLDLLTTQRADLLESKQTLSDTIEEINKTAKEKFTETFEKVRENFINIFKSLFDEGDEADLILQEHEDPLEARIDIVAKPRGKRPHSIEMLSGGEKTLTAIALLFAIYLVKPSPFCILDEVDAPLDDANIDRFIRILRRFSDNTQFIVVTHNKRTMSAADTLYGVTMEEEGVSKLVPVDFHRDNLARFSNN